MNFLNHEISILHAIFILNQAVHLDPEAMTRLFTNRVPCNERLAEHPTIQVSQASELGPLGLINGFFGVNERQRGHIVAVYIDSKLSHFEVSPFEVTSD